MIKLTLPHLIILFFTCIATAQGPTSRLKSLTDKFQDQADKTELTNLITRAKEIIKTNILASGGTCTDAKGVSAILKANGIEVGTGATFAYWKWKYPQYESFNHTAPSIVFKRLEMVIDATHMQFMGGDPLDEDIICLTPTDWMNELVTRTKGQNPILSLAMRSGDELYSYICPDCTKPELTAAQKKAVEEFDRLDDQRFKAQIRREKNDRRTKRCVIM